MEKRMELGGRWREKEERRSQQERIKREEQKGKRSKRLVKIPVSEGKACVSL